MSCADIMLKNPPTLRVDDTVGAAAARLIDGKHISLPVVGADGRYMGMFGITDLLGILVPRVALAGNLAPNVRFIEDDPAALRKQFVELRSRHVGEFADRGAATLAPDMPQIEAIRLFCRSHTPLAVVEPHARTVVGVLSFWDAMKPVSGSAA
jgi:CBS domain-containing protein